MTEKRYKLSEPNGAYLIDNDRPYAHWINDDDKIIDLLNDLVGENEQLKARIKYLERKIQRERNSTQKQYAKWEKEAETKIKELSEENKQLKQLVNIADDLIDKLGSETMQNEWIKNF